MESLSHCPLDCPDACSLRVEVDDGRVVRVDGTSRNSITDGFICAKVRRFPEHMYGTDRVRTPLVRQGAKGNGAFRESSWEEALELVAGRMREVRDVHGGEAILPLCYGGSNGLLTQDAADARLFRRLGASNLARTVCAAPTTAVATAMYGKMPGVAYPDYAEARLIVVWGCNPEVSGIHLMPHIEAARRRGARVVVVDPRSTRLARRADLHLPVRPGTDVAVALALVGWLFENDLADLDFLGEHTHDSDALRQAAASWPLARAAQVAGVDVAALATLARWYADADPAVIRVGWGLERNRNGGAGVAAVLALPAVAGKFGRRGGGYTLSNSGAFTLTGNAAASAPVPPTRTVNMNRVGRVLTDGEPSVRLLFVYNCNPVAILPEQERVRAGLQREDLFTVVYDQVFTDTARFADVVLPATTFLEHAELRVGYGAMVLQYAEAVVPPVGEARPNYVVFEELCRRLGVDDAQDPVVPGEIRDRVVSQPRTHRELTSRGLADPDFGPRPVQFVDVRPRTADGKIRLVPAELEAEAGGSLLVFRTDPATERHPLALISPATGRTISSTLGQLATRPAALEMHPDDADPRGITDGSNVRVFNDLGEVHCAARVTRRVRPGVVFLPKGLWAKSTLNGRTSNALVSDALTDVAGGATFNDARVQVEPLAIR